MKRIKYFWASFQYTLNNGKSFGFGNGTVTSRSNSMFTKPYFRVKQFQDNVSEKKDFETVTVMSYKEISKAQLLDYNND